MRWYSVTGSAVRVGDTTVTPYARVLSVGGAKAGFAWQYPTGVRVERAGIVEWRRIVDVTRIAQVALFAVAAVLFVLSRGRNA